MRGIRRSAKDAILEYASPEPNTGCWLWTGYTYGHMRYGKVCTGGRYQQAHTVSYKAFKGNIPPGLELHHICENKLCVNPDHLEAITHAKHMRKHGRYWKTHCKHGHELTEANVILFYRSRNDTYERICLRCRDARNEARWV